MNHIHQPPFMNTLIDKAVTVLFSFVCNWSNEVGRSDLVYQYNERLRIVLTIQQYRKESTVAIRRYFNHLFFVIFLFYE